jgi:2-hydroxy-6-oxonona-2,4-dienedioate hydrolase
MAAPYRGSASSAATASITRSSPRVGETVSGSESPAAQVARLAAAGRRIVTPCGDGGMVWRVWGEGEPLVLFHGGFGSWTHWLRNIPELSRHYRVIVANLPGLGESDEAPRPHAPGGLAAIAVDGIARILAPGERFHLTGFSFGGLIGGHVAAALGERCRSLTLVGAGGLGLKRSAMAPLKSWRHIEDEAGRLAVHRENLAILMLADRDGIDDMAVYLQSENAPRGRVNSPPIASTDTLTRVLPRLRGRLAGIWGERDATAMADLPARARLLRGIQPRAPFIVIADAGHWVQYEAAEAFNQALLATLAPAGG